jgi:hypothetical protein
MPQTAGSSRYTATLTPKRQDAGIAGKWQNVPAKLEGTLDGVTDNGRAETGQEGTGTLGGNDLTEGRDHALRVSVGRGYQCANSGFDSFSTLWLFFLFHV